MFGSACNMFIKFAGYVRKDLEPESFGGDDKRGLASGDRGKEGVGI